MAKSKRVGLEQANPQPRRKPVGTFAVCQAWKDAIANGENIQQLAKRLDMSVDTLRQRQVILKAKGVKLPKLVRAPGGGQGRAPLNITELNDIFADINAAEAERIAAEAAAEDAAEDAAYADSLDAEFDGAESPEDFQLAESA